MEPTQPGPWQWLSQTFEAISVCADTNLNTLRQLTDFSANVARENVSLGASLQASNIEAVQRGPVLARVARPLPAAVRQALATLWWWSPSQAPSGPATSTRSPQPTPA